MTVLLYTYTDWQSQTVPYLKERLSQRGENLFWIGRRSSGFDSATVRGVPPKNPFRRKKTFEEQGPLPLLDDPVEFENAFLSDYVYQMNRYAKGYGSRGHDMRYFHEYRDHFHLTARKFKRLLAREEITSLLFFNMPHTGDDYLLYRVAESMGLRIVMLLVSPFEGQFFSTTSIEAYGQINWKSESKGNCTVTLESLDNQVVSSINTYMSGTYKTKRMTFHELRFALEVLLRRSPLSFLTIRHLRSELREIVRLFRALRTRRRTIRELLYGRRTRNFLRWVGSLSKDVGALPDKFVYVPLHFQPELTTSPQGGVYGDQALAIEMLASTLPKGVEIVAKENPKQGSFHREPTFFDRLRQLDGVRVLHPTVSNRLLEEKCSAVAVVTGTAGWEAIRDCRPCICFGHAWYRSCPGVHRFHSKLELPDVLADHPTVERTEKFLNDIVSRSHVGIVYEVYLKESDAEYVDRNFQALSKTLVGLAFEEIKTTFDA